MSYLGRQLNRLAKQHFSTHFEYNKLTKKSIIETINQQTEVVPKSPILGPVTVLITNPTVSNKKYRWCACGLSNRQPLCDDSHVGTKFKPYRFSIEQQCKEISLCGCKFTTQKPFCDGVTCVKMKESLN